jgi:hypothetical protein
MKMKSFLLISGLLPVTATPGPVVNDPILHYGAHWLSQIDKIGFKDLMNGGLSDACSRIDRIEVYAKTSRR